MCTKTCNCLDLNERCDMKGGVCTSGCDSGWVGEDCYTGRYITLTHPLRKHVYSNILKILRPKIKKFQIKNSDIFHSSARNIDCGYSLEPPRRGGSKEYPQSMF